MKKSFSKKLLSLLLAVMMLVTAAPLVPFTAEAATVWTQVASSDFTKATLGGVTDIGGGNYSRAVNNAPTLSNGDTALSWTAVGYGNNVISNDASGIKISDGYLYLNAGNNLGLSTSRPFKLDFEFGFSGDFTGPNSNDDRYGFLTLGSAEGNESHFYNDGNLVFGQNGNGTASAQWVEHNVGKDSDDNHNLSTSNHYISAGQTYHYVLSYTGTRISAYIADAGNNPLLYLFDTPYEYPRDNQIKSVRLGDDDSSMYYHNLIFKSIAFYSGVNEDDASTDDTGKNHYVFAYFTGDEEGQKIRFALSSDGHTFAPLNGNQPYLKSETDGAIYPSSSYSNGRGSVYPACGYARDPFIIKKVDSDGYWIVATDLKVEKDANGKDLPNTYNNSKLLVWNVPSLEKASKVTPWNIDTNRMFKTDYSANKSTITWAPEIVYDYSKNMYMLYWSGPLYGSTTIMCAYTNDFQNFYTRNGDLIDGINYEPEVLYSYSGKVSTGGASVDMKPIDADIVYNEENQTYYMVLKNELGSKVAHTGELFILKSETLDGFINKTPTKINLTGTDSNGDVLVFEGPELYQRNDGKWVLITDQYSQNPLWDYYMIVVNDIEEFFSGAEFLPNKRDQSTNINDCLPRHGAVATIDTQTYLDLAGTSSIPSGFPYKGNEKGTFGGNDTSQSMAVRTDYKNVLYAETGVAGSDSGYNNTTKVGARLATIPSTVLYDGTDTQLAIMLAMRRGGSNRYPMAAWITTADWGLVDSWRGNTGTNAPWDHYWAWLYGDKRISNTTAAAPSGFNTWNLVNSNPTITSSRQYNGMANFMRFTGSFAEHEYLKTYNTITVESRYYSQSSWNPNDVSITASANNTIRVINYKPIRDAADAIKAKYNEVINSDLSTYCPESLDAYFAAVAKVTADINVYFMNGNYYEKAARHIQEIVENGDLDLAVNGPRKARIQYGNVFDFDAFYSSGSLAYIENGMKVHKAINPSTGDTYPIKVDPATKTLTITGANDTYTNFELRVDTYRIPIEEGQKYIFEYTADSPYANAMVFFPNDTETQSDGAYHINAYRPIGAGTQKIEFTAPAGKKYVFFRFGVVGASVDNPQTVKINRIKFYKAEYENWASYANDTIPADRLANNCQGLLGKPNTNLAFTSYGEELATPTKLDGKHFCGWYADEALTKPVDSPDDDDVNGCAVLYAKYSDTNILPAEKATCTVDGKTEGQVCSVCGETEVEQKTVQAEGHKSTTLAAKNATCTESGLTQGAKCSVCQETLQAQQTVAASGHQFKYNSKVDGTDNYKFICTHDHNHTNLITDSSVYEHLDMIKDTLDVDRYANKTELQTGITQFEAMKTNVVDTFNDDETVIANSDLQPMIDQSIKDLLTAMSDSTYSTFNLTFNVYVNGVLDHTETYNKPYNTVMTLDASPYTNGGTCQAWTAQTADTQGTLKAIAQKEATNTYEVKLQSDSTINAYYVTDDQTNVVTVLDQYGVPLYHFVADSITIGDKVITASGVDYKVPDMPYMAVTGFKINGSTVSGTVAVDGHITVRPIWDIAQTSYTITLDGEKLGDYKYDGKVTVTAPENAYAVAIKVADNDYRVVAYGNEYSFFANRNMDFYSVNKSADGAYTINGKTVDDKLTIHKLDYKLPFVYSAAKNSDPAANKYTAFNSYSVGSDAKIIEVGTLFYKGTGNAVPGEMTIDNSAISRSVSKTQVAPGNQYSLSANGAIGSATGLTTRAYVKYSYYDEFTQTTVIAVEYANVCSTETLVD